MTDSGTAGTPPADWLEGFVIVGTFAKPHGIKGEIKVWPETFDFDRYRKFREVRIGNPATQSIQTYKVEGARTHGEAWLLKIEGFDNPEDVAQLRTCVLLLPEKERRALPEGQYYLSDLTGLQVIDLKGQVLGSVIEVEEYPSVHVFELKIKGKKVMAPWVTGCIGTIDLQARTVELDPEFLTDTYPWLEDGSSK